MMHPRRVVAAAVAALIMAAGFAPAPANATTTEKSFLEAVTSRLYDGCHDYGIPYTVVDQTGAAASAEVSVEFYTAAGEWSDSYYENVPVSGGQVAGDAALYACAYEGIGDWYAALTVDLYDAGGNYLDTASHDVSIWFTRTPTRTRIALSDKTPRFNQRVRIVATTKTLKYSGLFGGTAGKIKLRANCGKGWYTPRAGVQWTDSTGKAVWVYRWNVRRSCQVRALTVAESNHAGSRSTTLRTRTGGGKARTTTSARALPTLPLQ